MESSPRVGSGEPPPPQGDGRALWQTRRVDPVPAPATSPARLVLASGSRYRAAVLAAAGYRVTVDPPGLDERALDGLLAELGAEGFALELARRKSALVRPRHHGAVVVAADQVGILDGPEGPVLLTKTPEPAAAVDQLVAMSGTTHRLVNGVVAVRGPDRSAEGVDVVEVTMRPFDRSEAQEYVRRFAPHDTAGSYRIEDGDRMAPLAPFVVDVVGEDRSGVLGMPLPLLGRLLDRLAA